MASSKCSLMKLLIPESGGKPESVVTNKRSLDEENNLSQPGGEDTKNKRRKEPRRVMTKALEILESLAYEDLRDLMNKWKEELLGKKIYIQDWPSWEQDSGTWIFHGLQSDEVSTFRTSLNSKLKGKPTVWFKKECCVDQYYLQW